MEIGLDRMKLEQAMGDDATTAPQDIGQENAASFEVYRELRHAIISCNLRPNERLRFDALRTEYGAGIGTLREALSHLVSDGLVRKEVGRGFRVAPVSLSDLMDITEWRVEFEVRAVIESIRKGDDDWEAEIVTAFHLLSLAGLPKYDAPPLEWFKYGEKHIRFHNALVASCGSPWLLHFRSSLLGQSQRYQALAISPYITVEPKVYRNDEEHRTILDVVLARDEKRASELIEAHIRRTSSVVEEVLLNSDVMTGSALFEKKSVRKPGRPKGQSTE